MAILVNGQPIEAFNFAGGECHVRLDLALIGPTTAVTAYLYNSDDVMRLLLTVDAIRRVEPNTIIDLFIPYFPYARQDRVCYPGEAFSAQVMADLINGLDCAQVTIVDPHSDVTPGLIDNCRVMSQADIVVGTQLADTIVQHNWTLIAPDAGAKTKTQTVAERLTSSTFQPDVFCASKQRETNTGKITATVFDDDVAGKDLIILDDICDGGRTFIELAKVLKEKGANDIYLYVTHGIFSKGLDVLKPYFKHIYTYNLLDRKNSAVTPPLQDTPEISGVDPLQTDFTAAPGYKSIRKHVRQSPMISHCNPSPEARADFTFLTQLEDLS